VVREKKGVLIVTVNKAMHLMRNLKRSIKESTLLGSNLSPFVRLNLLSFGPIGVRVEYWKKRLYRNYMRSLTISRKEFLGDLKDAIDKKKGYAVGKIGFSEQHWMYYEILLSQESNYKRIKDFEEDLHFHGLRQEGVFPATSKFYLEFNKFYIQHVKNIDCLGICYRPWELEIIRHYHLKNKFILYHCQEPFITFGHITANFKAEDRIGLYNEDNCYLKYFEEKRILLICPFAGILKERGTKEIFEKIWSKIEKKWFSPKELDILEFPYGFSSGTQKRFGTAINLFNYISEIIETKDFDIALIAAAGLAIPIASFIKSKGKVAIDIGGHLQILFGILGKRWLQYPFVEDWSKLYFNESWIHMPSKYRPTENDVCDKGAYW
jgi:hypothetical protein